MTLERAYLTVIVIALTILMIAASTSGLRVRVDGHEHLIQLGGVEKK